VRVIKWLATALCLIALPCGAAAATAPQPPSAHDFARAPAIDSVTIAPDGGHLAALSSPDGEHLDLVVWRTDALASPPIRVRATHMRFISVAFLKNDRLLVEAVQPVRVGETEGFARKVYVTDLEGKTFSPLLPEVGEEHDPYSPATVISTLPRDPRHVLVSDNRDDTYGDVYLVDVYSMSAAKVFQRSEKLFDYQADLSGQLRARDLLDIDNGKAFIAQQYRDPDTGRWVELFRWYAKDRIESAIVGFTRDPHVILIATPGSGDKTGIYEYDTKARKIIEPAFEHKIFEAAGVIQSHAAADYGRVLGFVYLAERPRIYWLDPQLDALDKHLQATLGASTTGLDWTDPGTGVRAAVPMEGDAAVMPVDWSDDFKDILVEKAGPRTPAEYYLLANGKLSLLGKARPWIDPAALGETSLVEYPARDGLMIPAYLTLPPQGAFGAGPYPTLIMPHGGPWSRDFAEWDPTGWTQYFASRGYAVLQPQFRGSQGWGQKLWRAGDAEWGGKMQDDLDDGVKWLVGRKTADPARVAIFGYSYGGYAALAAAIRPNGLYQCAISGAGAGDLTEIASDTYDNRFGREFQRPTIKGLDPLAHAGQIKIPVLIYHGDHDQTVDPEGSRRFASAAHGSGQQVKYVSIPDMGHQLIFWTPEMAEEQLTLVDTFLKTGCKPGGL
jgi:dienelactone hydrolase